MSNRIVFFGSCISEGVEKSIFEHFLKNGNYFSISNIVYERKVIEGFQNKDFIFISCPTIGKYPENVKTDRFKFDDEGKIKYCEYKLNNFQIIRKSNAIKKKVNEIIKGFSKTDIVAIVIMEMHIPFQKGAFYLARKLRKKGINEKASNYLPLKVFFTSKQRDILTYSFWVPKNVVIKRLLDNKFVMPKNYDDEFK